MVLSPVGRRSPPSWPTLARVALGDRSRPNRPQPNLGRRHVATNGCRFQATTHSTLPWPTLPPTKQRDQGIGALTDVNVPNTLIALSLANRYC